VALLFVGNSISLSRKELIQRTHLLNATVVARGLFIASLKAREETHTREETSISVQCGKSSEQTENGLSTGEKLVTCIQCAESFDREEAFKKHRSTPCTEPLFKCEPSEKTFSISELLSCDKQENRE